ncbi:MAG TPA: MFS transporter [Casimicrobiaceae bacterium]|nr:MFS transporter [Casimicrobiaceae bacterium]
MPRRLVLGLGVTQIISWGALIYAIAVLGSPMAEELGVSRTVVFGAFSASLVVSGLAGPRVGRLIDRRGGRNLLALGSIGAAISLALIAFAPGVASFFLAWLLAGIARAMTLYEAAFATLSQHTAKAFRNSVTALTLLGGLAGTVFFPLSLFGLEHLGWRGTLLTYAAAELLLCLPLHLWCIPHGIEHRVAETQDATSAAAANRAPRPPASFAALSTSFALSAFITSAISVHVINLLQVRGLSVGTAVFVASLIGPMQVAGRLVELAFGRRFPAVAIGAATLVLLVLSLLSLSAAGGMAIALAFALSYGCANGVQTIVRGTVPAELFGREGYGHTVGRLAAPSFIARAVAPIGLTLVAAPQLGVDLSVPVLVLVAALALVTYLVAVRHWLRPARATAG